MRLISSVTLSLFGLALVSCGSSSSSPENDEFLMPDGSSATVTVKNSASLLSIPYKTVLAEQNEAVELQSAENDDDAEDPEATNTTRADSVAEMAACAQALGVEVGKVVAVGNKQTLDLTADSALFIKVKGNKATANINLATESADAEIPGVCIVVAGNKSTINITQAAKVDKVVYKAKGNKSTTNVTLGAQAGLKGAVLDVKGNKTKLAIKTNASVNCSIFSSLLSGNKTEFSCE